LFRQQLQSSKEGGVVATDFDCSQIVTEMISRNFRLLILSVLIVVPAGCGTSSNSITSDRPGASAEEVYHYQPNHPQGMKGAKNIKVETTANGQTQFTAKEMTAMFP